MATFRDADPNTPGIQIRRDANGTLQGDTSQSKTNKTNRSYGPAGSGTVPMLFIATGQDKVDPTGTTSTAAQTAKAKAGKPVLVTSQRELTQNFGNVDFRKVSGTVQQGDETNEYGLLAAYSFLGQSSAAYIVRADVDLTSLRPQSSAPTRH